MDSSEKDFLGEFCTSVESSIPQNVCHTLLIGIKLKKVVISVNVFLKCKLRQIQTAFFTAGLLRISATDTVNIKEVFIVAVSPHPHPQLFWIKKSFCHKTHFWA